nr:NAD-dependent epimerase/dehydratase family protein [Bradyrhizobium japonicum]
MSMWVTGANGFIGRHLVHELTGGGHVVHGVGHGALDPADARALGLQTWINGEVDAANLSALAAAHGLPSHVFHLAGDRPSACRSSGRSRIFRAPWQAQRVYWSGFGALRRRAG